MDLGRKMSVVVQIFDSVIKMYLAGVVSVCVCVCLVVGNVCVLASKERHPVVSRTSEA